MTDTTHPRRMRGEAVAEARYARRLNEAGNDSAAVFMAHVDRIRALKNALLTMTAARLLADLLDRSGGPPAKFTPLNFTPPHDQAEPATCGDVEKPALPQSNPSPVKTDPKETP